MLVWRHQKTIENELTSRIFGLHHGHHMFPSLYLGKFNFELQFSCCSPRLGTARIFIEMQSSQVKSEMRICIGLLQHTDAMATLPLSLYLCGCSNLLTWTPKWKASTTHTAHVDSMAWLLAKCCYYTILTTWLLYNLPAKHPQVWEDHVFWCEPQNHTV